MLTNIVVYACVWIYTKLLCLKKIASSTLGIVFNPSIDAITDHSQSTTETDPYFKSKFYVEDPAMGWENQ